ncbi:MAG: sulfotransferase family 2 domain-containing protein [Oceanicaulis sp.]
MIVSHRHRLIFIKTVKTAGTSVEVMLSRHCGREDIITPVIPREAGHSPQNHRGLFNPADDLAALGARKAPGVVKRLIQAQRFYNHMPARIARARLGEAVWSAYFKFTIERDPWEKTLSYFHMTNARRSSPLTLDAFLDSGRFAPASELYTDAEGRILVDKILQYETLEADLRALLIERGIPDPGTLPNAKGGYRRDRRAAGDILTRAQAQRIAERYAFEIEHFGYTLEQAGP